MVTAEDFRKWQAGIEVEGRGIRGVELARRLGKHQDTISTYRTVGIPDSEESVMRLAMAAISAGIKPFGEEQ